MIPKYVIYVKGSTKEIYRIGIYQSVRPDEGVQPNGDIIVYWYEPIPNTEEFMETKYYSDTSVEKFLDRPVRPNPVAKWNGVGWEWSPDAFLRLIRAYRNKLLLETDWAVLADTPFTEEQLVEIKAYRQALRDFTVTEDPDTYISVEVAPWPTKPDFL